MEELFNLFEEMNYPYFRQGTLTDETYPDSFFTFWNIDTPNDSFYDNDAKKYIELVNVGFYTNDPILIYSVMDDFIRRAKIKGFTLDGRAYDVPSDKDNYYGRMITIKIIHKED